MGPLKSKTPLPPHTEEDEEDVESELSDGSPHSGGGKKKSASPHVNKGMHDVQFSPFANQKVVNPYGSGVPTSQSPTRDTKRAKPNSKYLFADHGIMHINDLDEEYLTDLGFGLDVQESVIFSCTTLLQDYSPPNLSQKHISYLTKLDSLSPVDFVDWYTNFCYEMDRHNIGLVPFDAIMPKWLHVGLCLPGVGGTRYLQMSGPLFMVLKSVLPQDNLTIKECMAMYMGKNQDGYRFLYTVMSRSLPVFCAKKSLSPPTWMDHKNVTMLAKHFDVYFRFNAKRGAYFTPSDKSLLFLDAIEEHSLLPMTTTLKHQINAFLETLDEFAEEEREFPVHLSLAGIVSTLVDTKSPVTTSIRFASSNATISQLSVETGGILQGAEMHATISNRGSARKGGRRAPKPRRPSSDVVCRACQKTGHEESTCRALGQLIILAKRLESLDPAVKKKVLDSYKAFYKRPAPAVASLTSVREFEQFCAERDISEEYALNHYNWDAFCAGDGSDSEFEDAVSSPDGDTSE